MKAAVEFLKSSQKLEQNQLARRAKDIDDIPESVRNDLTIITADHIDTVLENALVK